jgi:hypothetical protein
MGIENTRLQIRLYLVECMQSRNFCSSDRGYMQESIRNCMKWYMYTTIDPCYTPNVLKIEDLLDLYFSREWNGMRGMHGGF